ncbi:hypothetical protein D3C78_900880 [compost metagenome]
MLQVGEDIVQLFFCRHHVQPKLAKHTVGGLRHFAVQDIKRQAVTQRQLTDNRLVRAVPGKRQLNDGAFKFICQLRVECLLLVILTHLAYELSGNRFLRMREDAQDVALFHHLTIFHHRHAVADFAHNVHFMRNQHNRQLEPAVNVEQQIKDLIGRLRIERRGRLIAQQNVRVIGQRTGNANALLLPTAQLGRIGIFATRQAHQLHQFRHARRDFVFRYARDLHGKSNVLADGSRPQQVEVLENHADFQSRLAQCFALRR